MNDFNLALAMVGSAIVGTVAGGSIEAHAHKWDDVMVVLEGTVVKDPSTLTPTQLAHSQVLSLRVDRVYTQCASGRVQTGPEGCLGFESVQ